MTTTAAPLNLRDWYTIGAKASMRNSVKRSESETLVPRLRIKWLLPACIVLPLLFLISLIPLNQRITINLQKAATRLTPAEQKLLEYAHWHKQQRLCLTDSSCTNPPLLVWKCPRGGPMKCAGIGDRFRGLAFSLLLAVATKRLFLIDWPHFPYPLEHAVIPASFNWTIPNSFKSNTFPFLDWFSCVPPRPCDRPSSPPITDLPPPNATEPDYNLLQDDINNRLSKYPYLTISTRIDLRRLMLFQTNPHLASLVPEIQDTDLVELQRLLFAFLFTPSPGVQNMMRSAALRPFERYDGLHVRTGEDVGETRLHRFKKMNKDMNATVSQVLSCVKKKQAEKTRRVFLASDSVRFKAIFRERATEVGIDVLYLEQRAFHFGLSEQRQKMKEEERRSSFLAVFADLFLLAGAGNIMSTRSGFSRTAFCFGSASRLIVLKEECPL